MKRHRLPFRDDMVRAIMAGQKTVTRRASDRLASWKAGDVVDVCEGLRLRQSIIGRDAVYTADGQPARRPESAGTGRGAEWTWKVSRLAPRYCPAGLVRTRLEVVSVTTEPGYGAIAGTDWCDLVPRVDNDEAHREGFADRDAFVDAWRAINETTPDVIYRIEFKQGGS